LKHGSDPVTELDGVVAAVDVVVVLAVVVVAAELLPHHPLNMDMVE